MIDPPPVNPQAAAHILSAIRATPAMARYSTTLAVAALVYDAADLAWLAALLQSRLAGRLSERIGRRISRPFTAGAVFWVAYRVVSWLLFLPFFLWFSYQIPHRYGLSTQSLNGWFRDDIAGWLVTTAAGAALAGLVLVVIKRAPRRWPYLLAVIMAPLIAAAIFLAPLAIDPLFNAFKPLPKSSPLRPGIERLAIKAGIPHAQIFVVDKSRQTRQTNAYVTGLGSSERIVIWDTIIRKTSPRELDAVLAHEMGHYVERHVEIGFVVSSISLFVLFPLVRRFSEGLLKRFGGRWGIATLHEPAALLVIVLVVDVTLLVSSPISEGASRYIEHRADAFGLALSGDRIGMAEAFVALSRDNLADPNPPLWIQLLESHPSLSERVRYALYGRPSRLWPIPPQLPASPSRSVGYHSQ